MNSSVYKYNEAELIQQLQEYVDSTYSQHYSQNNFQATEFIIDGGHGMGFCLGNVMKYAQRYGKKDGFNRKDIMKIMHYALIALYVHDLENAEKNNSLSLVEEPIELNYNVELYNENTTDKKMQLV